MRTKEVLSREDRAALTKARARAEKVELVRPRTVIYIRKLAEASRKLAAWERLETSAYCICGHADKTTVDQSDRRRARVLIGLLEDTFL